MFKDKIILNSINPIDIYGANDEKINLIKSHFKNIIITVRGLEIFLSGEKKEIQNFKRLFNNLVAYIHEYNELHVRDIEHFLHTKQCVDDINVDFSLIGRNGLVIKPRTINQKKMIQLSLNNDLLFVTGPAGTGKTYMAIVLAVKALREKRVKKIILTRPAIEAGENLGFLPGDLDDKLSPYMTPLYEALSDIFESKKKNNQQIEIVPLAFMRGRTLDNAFVILDEAQNTTIEQMKMFLTRMGESAQFIICGDPSQIDLPKSQKSGLVHAFSILNSIDGISFIKFGENDIIRHKLVKSIIKAYKK